MSQLFAYVNQSIKIKITDYTLFIYIKDTPIAREIQHATYVRKAFYLYWHYFYDKFCLLIGYVPS